MLYIGGLEAAVTVQDMKVMEPSIISPDQSSARAELLAADGEAL
jgi:hypothetical protein